MIDLKTVSKPMEAMGAELETLAAPAARVSSGSQGSASGDLSRASRSLIVSGIGDPIVRPMTAGGLESLIGADDRTRILETDLYPWRMICALRMVSPEGNSAIGTGWLAGPKTVVTAGHCVHHLPFLGGWASRIEVSAGRNDSEFPFGTVVSTRFSSVDRWISNADPDFDIGCIHLEEPLGDQVGWFSFASWSSSQLREQMVNISGYPGDRGNGREQYFHANRVLDATPRRVFYDVDTFGGQSGAPVWAYEAEGGPPTVIGIHAYGTGGTPFDLGITANSAPRIIPEVFDIIQGWIDEDAS
ncbi:MAG: trypsin-like serine protease [Planctomycetota bacterium]